MKGPTTKEARTGWAVVTGASSGLGREFALALAGRGHPVLAVAHRLPPRPGGFEGLFARAVLDSPHDVAVADLHDDREVLRRHRDAAQL
jgi:NAD(P)-dependent dehydrogenase (short-subunit alcohol dehydrogenase family)